MVKTVRQFSICHDIDSATKSSLYDPNPEYEIVKEFPGIRWSSTSFVTLLGVSSCYALRLTPETGTEPKTITIKVILTNRNGEKFEETYVTESAKGECRDLYHKEKEVAKKGDRVTVTLKYDVEISGVFPEVQKPFTLDFGALDPVLNDVILVAGGQKFNVNKAILNTHSPYFRDLLATGNPEYELEDVAPKVLQELLQVIYHVPEIYDDNVEELLEAARKFDVPLVTIICAAFLGSFYCNIVEEEKKELIQKYNLENLVSVIPRDFSIREDLDDVILKVEDQRFHVNRQILATHSSYFYTMFFGGFRESKQSEIELIDTAPEAFHQLLDILYHCPNIHDESVPMLLELARRYTMSVTSHLESHLINSSLDIMKKFCMADTYNLKRLAENCASKLLDKKAIEEVARSEHFESFNQDTQNKILHRFLSVL